MVQGIAPNQYELLRTFGDSDGENTQARQNPKPPVKEKHCDIRLRPEESEKRKTFKVIVSLDRHRRKSSSKTARSDNVRGHKHEETRKKSPMISDNATSLKLNRQS